MIYLKYVISSSNIFDHENDGSGLSSDEEEREEHPYEVDFLEFGEVEVGIPEVVVVDHEVDVAVVVRLFPELLDHVLVEGEPVDLLDLDLEEPVAPAHEVAEVVAVDHLLEGVLDPG